MKAHTVAVDVGYGNTKYAFPMGTEIATGMFPSLAPQASTRTLTGHANGIFKSRDVTSIIVGGTEYEVGPGVSLTAAYGHTGRTLSEDFVTKAEYAALLGGALAYAQVEEVNQLVLGLPVHTSQKYAAYLRERFTGDIDFGRRKASIHSVFTVPQPLGALVTFMRQPGNTFDADNTYLVIDVGYFTMTLPLFHESHNRGN